MQNEHVYEEARKRAGSILRFLRGDAGSQEEAEVRAWMAEDEANEAFMASLENDDAFRRDFEFFAKVDVSSAWQEVAGRTVERRMAPAWLRYAAAISLVAVAGAGLFYYNTFPDSMPVAVMAEAPVYDVPPGGNKAILELADGSTIALEETDDGQVSTARGVVINKQDNTLIYGAAADATEVSYNKVMTPTGGQFRVVLPDGTRAWLNAESSLRYPTAFTGDIRTVEMTGEVYLEVAHNAAMPFEVAVGEVTIRVLGTAFNVMAYGDEPSVNATLVEGSVRVTQGGESRDLVPGQQARIGSRIDLYDVDVTEAVAWKDGFFRFNDTSLESIMRQLSRWYGVRVASEDMPALHFTGLISRDNPVSEVLNMLELTGGVSFTIGPDRRVVLNPGSEGSE